MLRKLFLIGLVTISSSLFAQAGFDDDVQDVAVPVDGGITFVVAGAIAYGISRSKQKTTIIN